MKCPFQKSTQYNGPLPCLETDCGLWDHDDGVCSILSIAASLGVLSTIAMDVTEQIKRDRVAETVVKKVPEPIQYCDGCDYFAVPADEQNTTYCMKYKASTTHNPNGAASRLNICLTEQGFR
jgi:hypothetical protein